jgi:hypothetical protein
MSLILTPLASDNFHRANESPLVNPPWALDTFGDPPLQVVSDLCEGSATESLNGELYTGTSLPNDQYATVTIANMANLYIIRTGVRITDNGASIYQLPGYTLELYYNSGWFVTTPATTLLFGSQKPQAGDVWTIAAVGSTIYVIANGVQLGSVTNTTYTSGVSMLSISTALSLTDIQVSDFVVGSAAAASSISGNVGVGGATVSYSGTSSGSVTADGSGNYTISGLANGSYTITPSLTGYAFTPASQNETVTGTNLTGVNFTATNTNLYSVPDCRVTKPNQATSRTVQGTTIYDVQTSSNPGVAGIVDCRKNKPVDSRVNKPQNCRTQPPFED